MQTFIRNSDALMRHSDSTHHSARKRWYVQTPDFYVPAWRAFVEIKARDPGAHVYDIGCQTSARLARFGIERYILVRGEPGVGWVDSHDYSYGNGISADATVFVGGRVLAERCRLGIVDDHGEGRLDWIPVQGASDAAACLHPDLIAACIAVQQQVHVPQAFVASSRLLVRSLQKMQREALGAFVPCPAERVNRLYVVPRYGRLESSPKRARVELKVELPVLSPIPPAVTTAVTAAAGGGGAGPPDAAADEYESAEEDARAGACLLSIAELKELHSFMHSQND